MKQHEEVYFFPDLWYTVRVLFEVEDDEYVGNIRFEFYKIYACYSQSWEKSLYEGCNDDLEPWDRLIGKNGATSSGSSIEEVRPEFVFEMMFSHSETYEVKGFPAWIQDPHYLYQTLAILVEMSRIVYHIFERYDANGVPSDTKELSSYPDLCFSASPSDKFTSPNDNECIHEIIR